MNNQVKIMLWCVPRSCSTAFSKAISQQENSKTVMEPFSNAYYHGEERVSQRYNSNPVKPNLSFKDIQKSLENNYTEFSVIFAKDMAYFLSNQMDRLNEVLPEGYVHTFLIRHPRKTVASLYKASLNDSTKGFNYFDPAQAEFKSLHDLFFTIKGQTGETPLVIDADDLLENPDRMLKKYCMKTGLTFSEKMLKWDRGGMSDLEEAFPGWQEVLNETTGFLKPQATSPKEDPKLSEAAEQAIHDNMEYYNTLYSYRISC